MFTFLNGGYIKLDLWFRCTEYILQRPLEKILEGNLQEVQLKLKEAKETPVAKGLGASSIRGSSAVFYWLAREVLREGLKEKLERTNLPCWRKNNYPIIMKAGDVESPVFSHDYVGPTFARFLLGNLWFAIKPPIDSEPIHIIEQGNVEQAIFRKHWALFVKPIQAGQVVTWPATMGHGPTLVETPEQQVSVKKSDLPLFEFSEFSRLGKKFIKNENIFPKIGVDKKVLGRMEGILKRTVEEQGELNSWAGRISGLTLPTPLGFTNPEELLRMLLPSKRISTSPEPIQLPEPVKPELSELQKEVREQLLELVELQKNPQFRSVGAAATAGFNLEVSEVALQRSLEKILELNLEGANMKLKEAEEMLGKAEEELKINPGENLRQKADILRKLIGKTKGKLITQTPEYKEVRSRWWKMTIGEKMKLLKEFRIEIKNMIPDIEIDKEFPFLVGLGSTEVDILLERQPELWTNLHEDKLRVLANEFFRTDAWLNKDLKGVVQLAAKSIQFTLKLNPNPLFFTKNNLVIESAEDSLKNIKGRFKKGERNINKYVETETEVEMLITKLVSESLGENYPATAQKDDSFYLTKYNKNEVVIKRDLSGEESGPWEYPNGEKEITDIPPHINFKINKGKLDGLQMHIFVRDLAKLVSEIH